MTELNVLHPVRDISSVEVEKESRTRIPHAVRYATGKGQLSIPDGMRYCFRIFVSTELQSLRDLKKGIEYNRHFIVDMTVVSCQQQNDVKMMRNVIADLLRNPLHHWRLRIKSAMKPPVNPRGQDKMSRVISTGVEKSLDYQRFLSYRFLRFGLNDGLQ
jgi:hypothetical protein